MSKSRPEKKSSVQRYTEECEKHIQSLNELLDKYHHDLELKSDVLQLRLGHFNDLSDRETAQIHNKVSKYGAELKQIKVLRGILRSEAKQGAQTPPDFKKMLVQFKRQFSAWEESVGNVRLLKSYFFGRRKNLLGNKRLGKGELSENIDKILELFTAATISLARSQARRERKKIPEKIVEDGEKARARTKSR